MATSTFSTITKSGKDGTFRNADAVGHYRYSFFHYWAGGPVLAMVGLNPPNTKDDLGDNATIRVVRNYAKRLNMGGVLMLNLYAWKATRPSHLVAAAARGEEVIGPYNTFEILHRRLSSGNVALVYVAWGKNGQKRGMDFLKFLGDDFVLRYVKAFWVNKDGSPSHPLHCRISATINPYYERNWFK